jgi:hypothetical protein
VGFQRVEKFLATCLRQATTEGMENKLSPRVMAAAAAYVERHGEEKTLKRLKGPVGRPRGSGHDNIDDSAALRNMAIEVFLGGQTSHAAAVKEGVWRKNEEFISLLEQKQEMEEGRQLDTYEGYQAYLQLIARIGSHYVRRPRPYWERLYRKFRERRGQLFDQLELEISQAPPAHHVELNKK